jgi:hypothetical protein
VGDTVGDGGGYGTPQTFSGTTKQVKLGKTTVTSGTQVAMKAVWANQAATVAGAFDTSDRSSEITVTTTVTTSGTASTFVDGVTGSGAFLPSVATVAGKTLRFDFGSGNAPVITGSKLWQSHGGADGDHGTWKWQGSNTAGGASGYVDIGTSFNFAGAAGETTFTALSANTTGYRYYQLLGISGSTGSSYWREMQFRNIGTTGKVAQLNGWAVNYGGFVFGGAA